MDQELSLGWILYMKQRPEDVYKRQYYHRTVDMPGIIPFPPPYRSRLSVPHRCRHSRYPALSDAAQPLLKPLGYVQVIKMRIFSHALPPYFSINSFSPNIFLIYISKLPNQSHHQGDLEIHNRVRPADEQDDAFITD